MNKEWLSLRKKTKRVFHTFAVIIVLMSVQSLINAGDFHAEIQASQITGSVSEQETEETSAASTITFDVTPTLKQTSIPKYALVQTKKIKTNLQKFGDKYLIVKSVKSNKVEIGLQNEKKAGQFISDNLNKEKKKTQINISLTAIGLKKNKELLNENKKLSTLLQKKSLRLKLNGGIIPNELYRTRFQMRYPIDHPSVKSSSYRYFCGVQLNASKLSESNGSATVQFKLPKEIVGVRTIKIKLLDDKKNLMEKKSIKNKSGSTKTFTGIKKNTRYYYTCEVKTSDKKQEKCTDLGLGSFIISTGNQTAKAKGTAENVEQSFIFRIASDSEMMY